MNLLDRYNDFYNDECSGLTHGGPISMQEMQALALECMVDAFICENLNREYNAISIEDIRELAEQLAVQGRKSVVDLKNYKEICEGLANETKI